MLELRSLYRGVAVHATADDEHTAALELLILVTLADGRITVGEQEALEKISDDFEWDSPTFSFATAFGTAMSRVREARLRPGGTDELLDSIDGRIASRVLRAELVGVCAEIADADMVRSAGEQDLLDRVRTRFSGDG